MKNNFSIIATLALGLFLVSCEDYLEETVVSGVSYQIYETPAGVEGALTAAYNSLRSGATSERALTFSDAGTDLFTVGSDGNTSFNQYLSTLSPLEGKIKDYWDYHYKGISECNVVTAYAPKIEMSAAEKQRIEAEARFLRAFYYFELVQHFGKIPLVLIPSDKVETSFKRAEVKDIYAAILADARFAFDNLPVNAKDRGRATKAAAAHLLGKIYLTRSSAVSQKQQNILGAKASDLDSVIFYTQKVVNKEVGTYALVSDFAKLFDISNQVNSEVIFAVQFTTDVIFNGNGNQMHLYHVPQYDAINTRVLARSVEYGRPYRRVRPTPFVYNGLFGETRKYDSRFTKSFVWGYKANKSATGVQTTGGATVNVNIGDTAVYFSPVFYDTPEKLNAANQQHKRYAVFAPLNNYLAFNRNNIFPGLSKWLDPTRPTVNETRGSKDWVLMRYAETLLILAEAYGRKGDFEKAAALINQVRERAAYKDGEAKTIQYWTFEGGRYEDRLKSTLAEMRVSAAQLSSNFVDFILDERGRELLGEMNRWEDLVRCEKLVERVLKYNPDAQNIRDFHTLRPIPQSHIDRLDPRGSIEEEQNPGYY